ncbi:MAG: PAS domain S-box protein [Ferruginibacter sp.]|nr:PAS domain S-box protein [Ferruginibacter sp.]
MNQLIDFFSKIFNSADWPPRWHCGKWSGFHGWLYIISDLLIWSAYFTIPLLIIKYITRKTDSQFIKLYFLFAAFILACGATHFLDALAFWFPLYRLNALVRLITGIISWVTVFYCIRYLPLAFTLRSQKTLEKEIDQRKGAEVEIRNSEEQVQAIIRSAPDAIVVTDQNGTINKWNPAAEIMFGWMEAEVMGMALHNIIAPDELHGLQTRDMKNCMAAFERTIGNKPVIQSARCKNEEVIEVEITLSPLKFKEAYLFIAFIRDVTERRKSELALKENEERYRLLISEVHDYAIIMLSPEGIISSWNEGAQRIKGYVENEIIGKHFSVFYTKEDIENNFPMKELAIVENEGRIENEGWRVKKDGTLFWANVITTVLKRDGTIIGFSKITRDITERKKAVEEIKELNALLEQRVIERTEELQLSEKKYRKLFENSPLPMWVLDLPGLNFIDVNEAAINNYGYSRQEFLSMTAVDIRPQGEKERFLNFDHSPARGMRNTGIWKHLKKDGAVIYAEVSSHEMNINEKKARLVLSIDVTEKEKTAERLDFALEAGQIGIWELDLINDSTVRNLRHDQLFGYENAIPDWGMKNFMSHIHPEDMVRVEGSFKQAIKKQRWVAETRIVWPDQSVHWVLITGKVIGDNKEKPLKMMGTVIDITKLKHAEEDIRQLNNELEERVQIRTRELFSANKELESFSYSVSHDLRAPLRAIHGYSQILQEDYKTKLDDEGRRILDRVMFNVKKMELLIDDLLEFSRVGKTTLNKTNIDITQLVKDVKGELGQSNKYHQNITIGELGTAIADELTIRLVFQNLLLNATKYSSKKENPAVEVGLTETDKGTAYFVKDNGAGFDMTYYDKLFGVFQRFHRQEEFEGIGVGLAIVQKIVLKHGGQVWAESVVNEGATFYFTLQ